VLELSYVEQIEIAKATGMEQPIRIYPEYAMILTYNIKEGVQDRYFRWMTNELLPALQRRKIYMQNAWHIIYPYETTKPERQVEFITEELHSLQRLMNEPEWKEIQERFELFTQDFTIRIVKYTGSFKL
jgi:hypothetical protein